MRQAANTGSIPVRHSGGPPFRRYATVNPNPNPDPRNGGPPEWQTPGMGGGYAQEHLGNGC